MTSIFDVLTKEREVREKRRGYVMKWEECGVFEIKQPRVPISTLLLINLFLYEPGMTKLTRVIMRIKKSIYENFLDGYLEHYIKYKFDSISFFISIYHIFVPILYFYEEICTF